VKLLTPEQAGLLFDPPLSEYRVTGLLDAGAIRSVQVGRRGKKFRRTTAEWVAEFQHRGQTVGNNVQSAPERPRASPVIGLQFQSVGK